MIDTITRSEAAILDGCAVWPHEVAQWRTKDGKRKGVKLKALTLKQRHEARLAATSPDGKIDQHKQMIEELRRGIVDPPNLPAEIIEQWNADVVLDMYRTLQEIAKWNPALVEAELERLLHDATSKD